MSFPNNLETHRHGYSQVQLQQLASDILHLNRYGRPITYDRMMAMENGPVPSTTYNILKQDQRYNVDYRKMPFDFVKRGKWDYVENPKRDIERKLFSNSDLEVLEEIVREYGKKTFKELYDLTHEHEGYKRAWRTRGVKRGNPIRFEDLIEEGETKAGMVEDMRATCRHVL